MTDFASLFAAMGAGAPLATELGASASVRLAGAGITGRLRIAHFIAQAAHETGGFVYFRELWGPTLAQRRYEGRADLGNTQPGDGFLFRGRGIFQLTGRTNYALYGAKLGIDLVRAPALASVPDTAVAIACLYWQTRRINQWADADDVIGVTKAINGGLNGLDDRVARLAKVKGLLP